MAAAILFGTVGCERGINDDILEPPANIKFATNNTTGSYFIQNSSTSVFKIPVGFTNVTNTERTIQLTYVSSTGAQQGVHYTAPASITIPAGKAIDSLEIKGLFAGYPVNRKDTLRITTSGGDAAIAPYNSTYTLVMQKYCPVVLDDLLGDYNNSSNSATGAKYKITVESVTSTGATTGYMMIRGLFNGTSEPVRVNLDWTNPANFTTTVVQTANIYNDATYGPVSVRPVSTGGFSSCANTFNISYQRFVSAGNFAANVTTMAR